MVIDKRTGNIAKKTEKEGEMRKKLTVFLVIVFFSFFWFCFWTTELVVKKVESKVAESQVALKIKELEKEKDRKENFLNCLSTPSFADGEKIKQFKISLRDEIKNLEIEIEKEKKGGVLVSSSNIP